MTIAVELSRQVDGPNVLAVLEAGGVEGKLSKDGCEVIVSADDDVMVRHLLEDWADRVGTAIRAASASTAATTRSSRPG